MDTIQDCRTAPSHAARRSRPRGLAAHLLARAAERILAWHDRAEQRRALMMLDERMLRDIGISRADAEHEAVKPFWRA